MSMGNAALLNLKREMELLALQDRFLTLDEVEQPILREGIAYWKGIRGARKYPSRSDVSPRDLGRLLRNTLLIGVLDGGADYEFRIVGDAPVVALGRNFQGVRLSEMDETGNMRGITCRSLYGHVVKTGEPRAIRGCVASNISRMFPIQCEAVFLPLGPDDATVDYILGFSFCVSHKF
jgi:hypothetical protein